ncbi:hypothetical protein B0T21DRAFT_11057 [Apiosordaria backusii]|uniref:Uncharacterized protein n=1 Tax=Apiosordaria backusii TaxID=314023 RepID=A0AA40EYC3_9PEZI|nr:hypothetical protein B0T21DRAFT_11057 [Apiosordaria backusii]
MNCRLSRKTTHTPPTLHPFSFFLLLYIPHWIISAGIRNQRFIIRHLYIPAALRPRRWSCSDRRPILPLIAPVINQPPPSKLCHAASLFSSQSSMALCGSTVLGRQAGDSPPAALLLVPFIHVPS